MSAKLRFFFLGSFGLVVFALAWTIFRADSVQPELATPIIPTPAMATPIAEVKKISLQTREKPSPKPNLSPVPSVAPTKDHSSFNSIETEHTYVEPDAIVYLEQSPAQREVLRYIDFVSTMKFPAPEEPEFIGVNDQGFDQYEYKARDGSYVKQWKRSNEIAVEEVTLDNGDKIIRRAPEQGFPDTTVSYESKDEKTYKSVSYRPDGTVASIYVESAGGGTTYYYDQQGRLTGQRTWATKEKK